MNVPLLVHAEVESHCRLRCAHGQKARCSHLDEAAMRCSMFDKPIKPDYSRCDECTDAEMEYTEAESDAYQHGVSAGCCELE